MSTWLDAKLYKVGSTMANFNKSRAEKGQQTVDYGRVELDMKPYLFSMALPTTGALPEAEDLAARFRELLNQGTFEGTVVRVEMPSAASWAALYAAAEEAAKEKAAAEAAAAEVAKAEEENAAEEVTVPEGDAAAEDAEPAEVAEGEAPAEAGETVEPETPAEPAAPQVVIEAVDYRLWDVVFEDGAVRTLDSSTGAWL